MCHAVWTKTNPVIIFSEKLHLNLIKCNKSQQKESKLSQTTQKFKKKTYKIRYNDPVGSLFVFYKAVPGH